MPDGMHDGCVGMGTPLQSPTWIRQKGQAMMEATIKQGRGTGRTTGLMLRAISQAILLTGEAAFVDHRGATIADATRHRCRMAAMCCVLGLQMSLRIRRVHLGPNYYEWHIGVRSERLE